ncbi:hypothetical protein HZC53_01585 [Candidatus Uhrbacteria bacterium]|nr:hypothetical protein [Candidatus Uhrbacteria bacterium]
MQAIRKFIALSLTTSAGIATAWGSVWAAEGVTGRIQAGLGAAAAPSGYAQGTTDLPTLVGSLINQGFGILGVLLLGLLLYGGILWMTARGESDKVKKATGVIRDAIIGLVIIVLAYALAAFVIASLGNATTGGTGGTGTP